MTIREFAHRAGHDIVGKLTYIKKLDNGLKLYTDEQGNEYLIGKHIGCCCIVTVDGDVI